MPCDTASSTHDVVEKGIKAYHYSVEQIDPSFLATMIVALEDSGSVSARSDIDSSDHTRSGNQEWSEDQA